MSVENDLILIFIKKSAFWLWCKIISLPSPHI